MAKSFPIPIRKRLRLPIMSREATRSKVLERWILECPGKGRGDEMQRYRYDVEQLSDDSWVYLLRPAGLNKGCDFVVCCEKWYCFKNRKDRPPGHKKMSRTIKAFGRKYPNKLRLLLHGIRLTWECKLTKNLIRRFTKRNGEQLA